jgi:hypothetical protein
MFYPARVEIVGGRYRASLLATPNISAEGDTGAGALAALKAEIVCRFNRGELSWVNVPHPGEPTGLPEYTAERAAAAEEMIAEIYRERDAQKAAEFPE